MTDPVTPGTPNAPAPPPTPPPTQPGTPGRVEIKVRKNGSLLVTGDFVLLDHEGKEIPRPVGKPNVALCRCGHSLKKPFCDSAHKTCGFVDPPEPAPTA
jgi:CDGSH-type Zn-finger protein